MNINIIINIHKSIKKYNFKIKTFKNNLNILINHKVIKIYITLYYIY